MFRLVNLLRLNGVFFAMPGLAVEVSTNGAVALADLILSFSEIRSRWTHRILGVAATQGLGPFCLILGMAVLENGSSS